MIAIFILSALGWLFNAIGNEDELNLAMSAILCISAWNICTLWLAITILCIVCIVDIIKFLVIKFY